MAKFWNFIENDSNPEEVELRIDGEIVDDESAWIYEWFGINTTSPNAFREELKKYSGKNLTVWIDSWGGDVTAAAGIYNALKEHGGKVTVKIDGKAVSAASVIAMAGDEVKISPVGIMMIHNPWTVVSGEAKDMRHVADVLDEIKETIINAYQFKTKKSRKKISEMMDNETWMSAKTALAEGFVDEILYTETTDPGQSVENSFMFSRMAIQNSASASMKRFLKQCKAGKVAGLNFAPQESAQLQTANNQKEDEPVEIKNVEDLRQHFPDLVAQVEAAAREEGAKNERERIKSIDEIANTIAPELVAKAKYDEPMTAQDLAFQALKADAARGQQYQASRANEIANSGVNQVQVAASIVNGDDKDAVVVDKIAAAANAKRNKGGNK